MLLTILKSKLHRARVTHAMADYPGSLGLAQDLMQGAGFLPYEKVLVANITNSHLDLAPLMAGLAGEGGWRLTLTDSPALADLCMRSCYAVFQAPGQPLSLPWHERAIFQEVDVLATGCRRLVWTDDASDMLRLLR